MYFEAKWLSLHNFKVIYLYIRVGYQYLNSQVLPSRLQVVVLKSF